MAADSHELVVPQRTMRPSIACTASRHTAVKVSAAVYNNAAKQLQQQWWQSDGRTDRVKATPCTTTQLQSRRSRRSNKPNNMRMYWHCNSWRYAGKRHWFNATQREAVFCRARRVWN